MDEAESVVLAVANEFLRRARGEGRSLRPIQLHELTYCAHGEHLAACNESLTRAPPMAYRGGVYFDELRRAGCWGSQALEGLLAQVIDGRLIFPRLGAQLPAHGTLDVAWRRYGHLTCYDLTRLVLVPGGPWDCAWNAAAAQGEECAIPDESLRAWFAAQAGASATDDVLPPIYRSPLRA